MEETALFAVGDKKNPKAGAVGLLLPNLELKLINPDDGQAITDRNQPGEMWIRGPSVMQGYHKNKETTDQCIDSDGFFHTGDVAYMDEDDQLCLVDNIKGLIKVKGFQVDPVELETHLLTHPKIGDAAVIGVAAANHGGERGDGQLPKALVVKKDDSLTEDEVMDFVKNDFVENKRLAVVDFIDAIPKSPAGRFCASIFIRERRLLHKGDAAFVERKVQNFSCLLARHQKKCKQDESNCLHMLDRRRQH